MADVTLKKRRGPGRPFKPGQSGNPAGRPVGAATAFGEKFWRDLSEEWNRRGTQVLRDLDGPDLAKIAAAKLPVRIEADVDVRISGWLDVLREDDGR